MTLLSSKVLHQAQRILRFLAPILVIIALLALFNMINPRFLSTANILNLLRQSSVLLIVAAGLTFVIMIGSIDLSLGAIVTFSAIVTAILLNSAAWPALAAIVCALLASALIGLVNGVVVVWGRVPSFITTLGTMTVLGGFTVWLTGGRNVIFKNEMMSWLASGTVIGPVPNVALWSVLFFLLLAFVCARTHAGRAITAAGAAPVTTLLSGFSVSRLKVLVFAISGLAAGLGGVMMVARTSAGTGRMGDHLLLDAIAAVVIGGTALSGGNGGVHRTIIGVAIIAIVKNGLNIAQVHPYWQTILTGIIVVFSVAATLDRTRLAFVK